MVEVMDTCLVESSLGSNVGGRSSSYISCVWMRRLNVTRESAQNGLGLALDGEGKAERAGAEGDSSSEKLHFV